MDTRAKARKVVEEGRLWQDSEHPLIWWVLGSDPSRPYRVQFSMGADPYVTCTCPHGLHVGAGQATCYHVEAVRLALESGADPA